MYAMIMVTFTINIPQMLVYIPYMDPMYDDMYTYVKFPVQWGFHLVDETDYTPSSCSPYHFLSLKMLDTGRIT